MIIREWIYRQSSHHRPSFESIDNQVMDYICGCLLYHKCTNKEEECLARSDPGGAVESGQNSVKYTNKGKSDFESANIPYIGPPQGNTGAAILAI